jgi:hypothetical protein
MSVTSTVLAAAATAAFGEAVAARPAFSLQMRTASFEAAVPMGARGRAGLDPLAASCGQLKATHADTRTAATARFFMTASPHSCVRAVRKLSL